MDNQDSKLNNAIDAFREHKKKSDQPANPQSRKRRKARFCGVVVNKRDIQRGLNAMDTTERVQVMKYTGVERRLGQTETEDPSLDQEEPSID